MVTNAVISPVEAGERTDSARTGTSVDGRDFADRESGDRGRRQVHLCGREQRGHSRGKSLTTVYRCENDCLD